MSRSIGLKRLVGRPVGVPKKSAARACVPCASACVRTASTYRAARHAARVPAAGPLDVDRPARRGAAGDAASSALRVAELAGLRAEDIVSRRGGWLLLVLGKGDEEEREAPLAREAKELIDARLLARPVTSSYVFTSFHARGRSAARSQPTERPMDPSAVW